MTKIHIILRKRHTAQNLHRQKSQINNENPYGHNISRMSLKYRWF